MRRPVRIGNVSGFYGDRHSAMRELVATADIDVITGDYLAELTMLILWKARKKKPDTGYAHTFLTQFREVAVDCAHRGIKVVVNAGGINPAGMAQQVRDLVAELGIDLKVAHVEGDDLMPRLPELIEQGVEFANLDTGVLLKDKNIEPVSANAYLGGWGIAAALSHGADIVITGRVTDAALVVGTGAWWHGWRRDDYDALAGAVAAGHIIECGPQATGGNYSQIREVTDRRYPGSPIAELAHDGTFVITKTPDSGGVVTPGTVIAQLLYEVSGPEYVNPDVVAHFDTCTVSQDGPNRVRVSGTAGTAPPATLKVAMNYIGGFRNTMTIALTGLDIEEKAQWAIEELMTILGGRDRFDDVDIQLLRYDRPDPANMAEATAHLRITVKDADRARVDRAFSNAVIELYVAGFAGFYTTTPPTQASEFGVYWPTLVPASAVEQVVVHHDGTREDIELSPAVQSALGKESPRWHTGSTNDFGPASRRPLGSVVAARSGDKGGNANVGVWTDTDERWDWLHTYLTVERFSELVPEAQGLPVRRYEFANLRALNFVIAGFLGDGVASCTRADAQAKSLGEYLRARHIEVPDRLV
ncbi:acyclic terpene utilization AtuA family protein [Mycobacteroides abscessus]|uniref:acyclic terpene utilization AtuA family protein n=1 Tax=Mycobacteroides abscessus TaxID=36809 RepID=UPI000698AFED|nr:acyclic terpene utilization AtuA family protein [Mycobacteroides abscessus]